MIFPPYIFVAGTDTDVGKTLVAAILMKGLNAAYWKPVQSGADDETDTEWIQQTTGLPRHLFYNENYRLRAPLSPHTAAANEGVDISLDTIQRPVLGESVDHLVIEGAGGLMVPLNENDLMVDLIQRLEVPVLLVARSGLGTINHTLLSLEKLRQKGIPVLGVVMNGPRNAANKETIEHFGKVPVCGEVTPLMEINATTLKQAFHNIF